MPFLGHGVGLRPKHYARLTERPVEADWLEVISENFMVPGGRPLAVLERVRAEVPVVLHGVSLCIGSTDPLDARYLADLRALADRVQPSWVSDHLCWGSFGGRYAHDLLPMPFTEEALAHVAARVGRVQDVLGRRILVENVSSYVTWRASTMTEWEFLAALADRSGCGILLDVNNVYVSARNHGFDAEEFLRGIPAACVGQFHLAGHADRGKFLLDAHDSPVIDPVWALYRSAVKRFGRVSTLVEWDEKVPEYDTLLAESRRAREEMEAALAAA